MATATKKKPAKKPKVKVKPAYLPGMEPPSIPKIDKLADDYQDIRDERMRQTEDEVNAAALLEAAMKEHGLTAYEYDGKVVTIQAVEKVKVAKKKEPKPEIHTDA